MNVRDPRHVPSLPTRVSQLRRITDILTAGVTHSFAGPHYNESPGLFNLIVSNIGDCLWVHDAANTLIFANDVAAHMLGFLSAQELLASSPESIAAVCEMVNEEGKPFSFPAGSDESNPRVHYVVGCRIIASNRRRWLEIETIHVQSASQQLKLSIGRDITERIQIDEERAKVEALRAAEQIKTAFIAGVSHELRTPLHHVKGFASTLLHHGAHYDTAVTNEYLQIIMDECDALARMISDLLSTSQLEMHTLALEIDSLFLDDLIRRVVQRWNGIEAHTFTTLLPDHVPPVPADALRIQQVLDNLLGNVVRHIPQHTLATISLEVRRDELCVAVHDEGPGIAAEHLEHIFDRFYQINPQSNRSGNGLGLFIAKGIVLQHGGRIWAESAAGAGTTFWFSLPRRRLTGPNTYAST